MSAFILQPLLYCYILLGGVGRHAELASAPHRPVVNHAKPAKPHPIHVSTSNVEFNKQDDKIEVICTLFTDDFEAALAKKYNAKTDLSKQEMHAAMDALVKKYIAANLHIKANDAAVNLNYLGYEINREATDVYLESDKIATPKKVDVEVSLLYDLFDDEINIVHVIVNGMRKSDKVNNPDRKIEQVF